MASNDWILSHGLSFCGLFAVSIGQKLYNIPVFYIALKVIEFLRIEDGLMGIEDLF